MRIVSPEEAVAGIRSRDQIYLQCAAATPSVLLDALVARAPDLSDVVVAHLHTEGPGPSVWRWATTTSLRSGARATRASRRTDGVAAAHWR